MRLLQPTSDEISLLGIINGFLDMSLLVCLIILTNPCGYLLVSKQQMHTSKLSHEERFMRMLDTKIKLKPVSLQRMNDEL